MEVKQYKELGLQGNCKIYKYLQFNILDEQVQQPALPPLCRGQLIRIYGMTGLRIKGFATSLGVTLGSAHTSLEWFDSLIPRIRATSLSPNDPQFQKTTPTPQPPDSIPRINPLWVSLVGTIGVPSYIYLCGFVFSSLYLLKSMALKFTFCKFNEGSGIS